MLRFMSTLNKSLNLDFKQIFAEVTPKEIEIVGKLVEINSNHVKVINEFPSETTMTLVAYEI